jgi:release factor glutamine methyltransferase
MKEVSQTLGGAVREAEKRLLRSGLDDVEARAQAEWLLASLCACGRSALRSRGSEPLDAETAGRLASFVGRREAGEPLQYILGEQEFMGYTFAVDPRVLIPRLDTEVLGEQALARIPPEAEARALDVGTGSGALAVSIALSRPRARVAGIDISEDALCVARENARRLGARVRFLRGDFFLLAAGERAEGFDSEGFGSEAFPSPTPHGMGSHSASVTVERPGVPEGAEASRVLRGFGHESTKMELEKFDVIVSNPPYIPSGELASLPPDVRREPSLALDGGKDGLRAYRVLASEGAARLRSGGWMLVEVGAGQADAVAALMEVGIGATSIHADWHGVPRVVAARKA